MSRVVPSARSLLPLRLVAAVVAVLVLACAVTVTSAHADPSNSRTYAFQAGSLEAGNASTCAVVTGRKVRCWGYGSAGRLGSNGNAIVGATAGSMAAMSDLPLPAGVASVSMGGEHACALFLNGTVRCWGEGAQGQLGNGSAARVGDSLAHSVANAADVQLPGPAVQISAGGQHTCALLATGKVRCWGAGGQGQLGNDDTASIGTAPFWGQYEGSDVRLPLAATAISAGDSSTCAILVTGKVRCWGDNQFGQLGDGTKNNIGDAPDSMENADDLALPAGATAISVGGQYACAVLTTGRARCWGANYSGQLGTNNTTDLLAPSTDVGSPPLTNVVAITTGLDHTCALLATKKVRCWGTGFNGALGYDSQDDVSNPVADVALPADAVAVTAGQPHSCALLVTGKVRCWGLGVLGSIGSDADTNIGDAPGSMAAAADLVLPSIVTTGADVSLTATANPSKPVVGGPSTVTVTVRNDGSSSATGIVVAAPLPPGTALSSSSQTQGTFSAGAWQVGSLAAGDSAAITLNVTMPSSYARPTATYEVTAAAVHDPDSVPNDHVAGQDDIATVGLETVHGPPDESAPDQDVLYQYAATVGSAGTGEAQFDQPVDVALDTASTLVSGVPIVFVSDFGNSRVQGFINGSQFTTFGTYGSGADQMRNPQGIAVNGHQVYVVDTGGSLSPRVLRFSPTGGAQLRPWAQDTAFATAGSLDYPGSTNLPVDVEANTFNGHVYVTDRPFKPVQEFDEGQAFVRLYGSGFDQGIDGADGVGVNPKSGKTYVADSGNATVRVYDEQGVFVTAFGAPGDGDGQFSGPRGVAVDPVGRRVYVVDSGNNRVQVFDLQGHYLTKFGSAGSGNGAFDAPRGIAVDPRDGKVYVADTGNNRVQVFSRSAVAPPPPPPPPPPDPGTGTGTTTTPTTTTPTPPAGSACTAPATPQSVELGLAKVSGCLVKVTKPGGVVTYEAAGSITLNGVPIAAAGSKQFVITPDKKSPTIGVKDNGQATFSLAGVPISKGSDFTLLKIPTTDKTADEKKLVELPAGGAIYGLKLKGKFGLSLGRGTDGKYYASFNLTIGLPEILKGADGKGGLETQIAVKVDENGRVNSNGVRFQVDNVKLGPLVVDTACFALIPGASTAVKECDQPTPWSFKEPLNAGQANAYLACKPSDTPGNHWSAALAITLPTPSNTRLGFYGSGNGPDLTSLGGFGQNMGIPLAEGVSLETLGAGVCLPTGANPELAIKGTVGIGLVPIGSRPLVTVDGSITYRVNTKTPTAWSLGFDGNVFIKDFGQIGSGGIQVYSTGTFGANISVSARVAGFLILTGKVAGTYAPKTKQYSVEGGVDLCPVGDDAKRFCLGANALVSNVGIAGCATATAWFGAGFGYKWGDSGVTILGNSCNFGPWRPAITGRAAAGGSPLTFTIPSGTKAIGFRAFGATAPPGLQVTGPDGYKVVLPADVPFERTSERFVMRNPQDRSTNVALGNLKPGTYAVTGLDADNPVTKLDTAQAYAPFSGRGTVKAARRGGKQVAVKYVLPTGASVSLIETAKKNGETVSTQTIAKVLRGTACPGAPRTVAGGQERCATVPFTPAGGPGGTREISAVVSRDGQPVGTVTVATFKAAAPKAPAQPRTVQLRRKGTTVTVRWSPAAGAARYGLVTRPAGASTQSRFLAGRCGAFTLKGIATTQAVSVSIAGIRADGVTGKAAATTLKARAASAGKGKALKGKVCR